MSSTKIAKRSDLSPIQAKYMTCLGTIKENLDTVFPETDPAIKAKPISLVGVTPKFNGGDGVFVMEAVYLNVDTRRIGIFWVSQKSDEKDKVVVNFADNTPALCDTNGNEYLPSATHQVVLDTAQASEPLDNATWDHLGQMFNGVAKTVVDKGGLKMHIPPTPDQ